MTDRPDSARRPVRPGTDARSHPAVSATVVASRSFR
jgi:hypothetical protein